MLQERILGSTTCNRYLRIRVLEAYLSSYSSCKNCVSTAIKLLAELSLEASKLYIAIVKKVDIVYAFDSSASFEV